LKPRDFRAGPIEDAVYDAVFQRAGILRVNNIEQLFSAAETLATAKPVYSDRLTILSNSYSLALLTSDALARAERSVGRHQRENPRGSGPHLPARLSD
jgi:acetyltransferase